MNRIGKVALIDDLYRALSNHIAHLGPPLIRLVDAGDVVQNMSSGGN
jgi:hypothetical protein